MEKVYKMTMEQFENAYIKHKLPPEQLVLAAIEKVLNTDIVQAFGAVDEDEWWENVADMTAKEAEGITVREAIIRARENPELRLDMPFINNGVIYGIALRDNQCYAAVDSFPVLDFVRYAYRDNEGGIEPVLETVRHLYGIIANEKCCEGACGRIYPPALEKIDIYHFANSLCYCSLRMAKRVGHAELKLAGMLLVTGAASNLFPEKLVRERENSPEISM